MVLIKYFGVLRMDVTKILQIVNDKHSNVRYNLSNTDIGMQEMN